MLAPIQCFWDYHTFVRDFLLTFPVFVQPLDLLQKLMTRFDTYHSNIFGHDIQYVYSPTSVPSFVISLLSIYVRAKIAILNLLEQWIVIDQGNDFKDPALCKYVMTFFLWLTSGSAIRKFCEMFRSEFKDISHRLTRMVMSIGMAAPPIEPPPPCVFLLICLTSAESWLRRGRLRKYCKFLHWS